MKKKDQLKEEYELFIPEPMLQEIEIKSPLDNKQFLIIGVEEESFKRKNIRKPIN